MKYGSLILKKWEEKEKRGANQFYSSIKENKTTEMKHRNRIYTVSIIYWDGYIISFFF